MKLGKKCNHINHDVCLDWYCWYVGENTKTCLSRFRKDNLRII